MRRILLLALGTALALSLGAQAPQWKFYDDQGLNVNAIVHQGGIAWLGTNAGVVRLDTISGQLTFTEELGIPREQVLCLAVSPLGQLWIGTNQGLFCYDGSVCSDETPMEGWNRMRMITALAFDPDGGLWIGCNDGWQTGYLIRHGELIPPSYNGLPHWWVTAIAFDSQNRAWIGTKGGLARLVGDTWTVFNESNSELPSNFVTAVVVDAEDYIWIGTHLDGLARFSGAWWTVYKTHTSDLPSNLITAIAVDAANHKWIGTSLGLVDFYATMTVYTTQNSELFHQAVKSLAVAPDQAIWIGNLRAQSFDGSLWETFYTSDCALPTCYLDALHVDAQNRVFSGGYFDGIGLYDHGDWHTWTPYENGIPGAGINRIRSNAQGDTWIASDAGLLHLEDGNWEVLDPTNSPLPEMVVHSLAVKSDGTVYCGSNSGLTIYQNGVWTTLDPLNSQLPNNIVTSLAFDHLERLWIGTWGGGLSRLSGDSMITLNAWETDLPTNFIFDLALDSQDRLWAICYNPDSDTNVITRFDGYNWDTYTFNGTGMHIYYSVELALDSQDGLWIATYGEGVIHFDGSQWTAYNGNNSPLPESDVRAIAIDHQDNVWIGMFWNAGIAVFNPSGIVGSADPLAPEITESVKLGNYPNPFNPSTTITYTLPRDCEVKLELYNLRGQKVAKLVHARQGKGPQQVVWNGRDEQGTLCASGIYLSRLSYGGKSAVGRMALVK